LSINHSGEISQLSLITQLIGDSSNTLQLIVKKHPTQDTVVEPRNQTQPMTDAKNSPNLTQPNPITQTVKWMDPTHAQLWFNWLVR